MESKFIIISKLSQLEELISYCKETGYASIDFETSAHNPRDPGFFPTTISVSFQPGSSWVVPLGHKDSPFRKKWRKVFKILAKQVLQNPAITKIVWNAIFEKKVCLALGYPMRGRVFDGMLAKYLLDETHPNDLKSQVEILLPDFGGYDLPGQPSKKASEGSLVDFWTNVPLETLGKYNALDSDCTFRLFIHYEKRLIEVGLYHYLRNFYGPLTSILAETVYEGVEVDRTYLAAQVETFHQKLDSLEKEVRSIPFIQEYEEEMIESRVQEYIEEIEEEIDSGDLTDRQIASREEKISRLELGEATTKKEQKLFEGLNFNSPPQMVQLLHESEDGFEFPVEEYTDSGAPSVGEAALKRLKGQDDTGFIELLLSHRELSKMFSTYISGIYYDHLKPWDRIHPGYLPHGTVTGRLSSRKPSFQTMPRTTTSAEIKRQFIAPEDYYFVEIDGSQMELRVVAEISRDEAMIQAFREGKNIHATTASLLTGKEYGLINSLRKDENHADHIWAVKEHKKAKVLNFTILYGAGPPTVSEFLTDATGEYHSKGQAQDMIDQWFEAYPGVRAWVKKVHKYGQKNGFVQSPFGRKRRLPILLNPSNRSYKTGLWNEALRQSANSIIQGAASDITQWVNIIIQLGRLKGDFPDYLRLVSTVHDSVEFYIHKADIGWLLPRLLEYSKELPWLKQYMGWDLKLVDMKFSAEFGINWGTMHEYDPKIHRELDFVKFYREEWDKYNQEDFPHIIR